MSDTINSGLKDLFLEGVKVGAVAPTINNPTNAGGMSPFTVIPKDMQVADLKAYFPPQRICKTVELLDVGSFIYYVNRFKGLDTLIFAALREDGATFTAQLDYHGAAPALQPAFLAHTAKLQTIKTPDFKTVLEFNKKPMTQVEFATFLEDNAKLFTEPTGADLLELVQTLFGKSDMKIDSALRLHSGGVKLSYTDDVELSGRGNGGDVTLPKEVTLTLPLFEGGAPYVIRARLKYRIEKPKIVLWYELISIHDIVRHALMTVAQQIAAPADLVTQTKDDQILAPGTGILPLLGSA